MVPRHTNACFSYQSTLVWSSVRRRPGVTRRVSGTPDRCLSNLGRRSRLQTIHGYPYTRPERLQVKGTDILRALLARTASPDTTPKPLRYSHFENRFTDV